MNLSEYFLEMADADFSGKSFNGPSLIACLKSLDAKAALFAGTWEGYSAHWVALHCAYCHWLVAKSLADSGLAESSAVPNFRFEKVDDPKDPPSLSDAEWLAVIASLEEIQAATMRIIRSVPEDGLRQPMREWKISYGHAIAWLCGHDNCHAAQLRNMGIPELKKPRR